MADLDYEGTLRQLQGMLGKWVAVTAGIAETAANVLDVEGRLSLGAEALPKEMLEDLGETEALTFYLETGGPVPASFTLWRSRFMSGALSSFQEQPAVLVLFSAIDLSDDELDEARGPLPSDAEDGFTLTREQTRQLHGHYGLSLTVWEKSLPDDLRTPGNS